MDEVISYEDITKMLDGQPSLNPRPNCMRLRAWSKHNADILAQIPHPDFGFPTTGMEGNGNTAIHICPHQHQDIRPSDGSRPHRDLSTIRTFGTDEDDRCAIQARHEYVQNI